MDAIFLSVDSHSKGVAAVYGDMPILQTMRVIVLTDLKPRATIDLLEILGVTMFPSILKNGKVHCGSDAFAVMHAITGVDASGEHVGGSCVQSLRRSQCLDAVLATISNRGPGAAAWVSVPQPAGEV